MELGQLAGGGGGGAPQPLLDADKGAFHLEAPRPPPDLDSGAQLHTLVVGAGPAGLLTACLLAKAGKAVCVFDMRPRPTDFYGSFPVVVNTRGRSALEALGGEMLDKLERFGRRVDHLHIVQNNRTMAKVDTLGVCIMRDQLVGLLLSIADQLGVVVYWSHKLLDIDVGSRSCTFSRGGGGEGRVAVGAEMCIGADGNYSQVRQVCEEKLGLQVQSEDWGMRMRYFTAPNPPPHRLPSTVDGAVHYVMGSDGYICQQPDGVWSISLSIFDDSEDYLVSSEASPPNIRKLTAECEQKFGPFAEHLLTSAGTYSTFFNCRTFDGKLIKCSTLAPTEWIALIGDAAHGVAPFTGEGINSALESAAILARTVISGGDPRGGGGPPCLAYDAERRQDAHSLFRIALKIRGFITGVPRSKCAYTFATAVLGIGKKLGCIRGTMNDYMLGTLSGEGVRRYTELIDMDERQRRCLYPCGMWGFYLCCCCCGRCK